MISTVRRGSSTRWLGGLLGFWMPAVDRDELAVASLCSGQKAGQVARDHHLRDGRQDADRQAGAGEVCGGFGPEGGTVKHSGGPPLDQRCKAA